MIKLYIKQIPDPSYRAVLINSLPEIAEQSLQAQLEEIEERIAKGDSMESLRQLSILKDEEIARLKAELAEERARKRPLISLR